jgi:Possible hemagglutinin (DUF637)/Papain fold toxin 1, glutamine deamidase
VVTGGVLAGMNFSPTGQPTINGGAQTFTNQLGQNLKAGIARTLVSTAINGGSLEDNLKGAITTAFIDTAAAQGANWIGDMQQAGTLDAFTHKLAHALAGCAAGAARAGKDSCAPGAIGAVIGEISAETYGKKSDTVEFAAMLSGIGVAMAGGDAAQIQLGSGAGANAAANNYLNHAELATRAGQQKACAEGSAAACKVVRELDQKSIDRNTAIREGTLVVTPEQANQILQDMQTTMVGLAGYKTELQSQLDKTSDPQRRAELQNQINQADLNLKQAANLGKDYQYALYQQTRDPKHLQAYAQLNTATNGNELADAMMAGAVGLGPFNKGPGKAAGDKMPDASANTGANGGVGTVAVDAGSVKGVNPTGSTQNCTNCVAVVDNLLTTGSPASALPRATPVPFDQLGQMYGTKLSGWTSQQNIESTLLAQGNGARAVIYGTDGATGHVWNAVVQNGKVNYIDGQIGGSGASNFKAFTNFQFGILP